MTSNDSCVQNCDPILIYWARISGLDPETINVSNSPKVLGYTMMDEPLTVVISVVYTKRKTYMLDS